MIGVWDRWGMPREGEIKLLSNNYIGDLITHFNNKINTSILYPSIMEQFV